ncbi:MAG: hypothetical protein JNL70_26030, partial [Saprospiraceae bacterium]|nr:hypothetical protein [Saprospiraceae bacterium]
LWFKGDDVLRVTARKDEYGEVVDWICNECRFDKKQLTDWVIEGPAKINRHSVISANHYEDGVSGLRAIQFDTRLALNRAKGLVNAELDGIKHDRGSGPLNPNNQAEAQMSLPEMVD